MQCNGERDIFSSGDENTFFSVIYFLNVMRKIVGNIKSLFVPLFKVTFHCNI